MSKKFSSLYRRSVIAQLSSCLVALLLLSPTNADGDTLLYDGFDYAGTLNDGELIAGENGGTGNWDGAWVGTNNSVGHNWEATGLTYSNGGTFPVSGGAMIDEITAGGPQSDRLVTANLIGDDATVWFSYLFKRDNLTAFFRFTFDGMGVWNSGSGARAQLDGNGSAVGDFTDLGTHLIVGRLVTSTVAADELDVWVDIPLTETEGTIDALTSSTAIGTWTSSGSVNFSSGNLALHTIDEFRIGDSLADVLVGIPEPNTFTLCALGLLGLLGWGRRRRRPQAA